jgi:hypothetical protein
MTRGSVAPTTALALQPSISTRCDAGRRETALYMDTDALVTRIKSEFNESPGMCLTLRQGARLWGIPPEECVLVVERLVKEDFLRWTRNGELVRTESGGYASRAETELGV